MLRWSSVVGFLMFAWGCGGNQPAPKTEAAPAAPAADPWTHFSDIEQLNQIFPGPKRVFATSQVGLVAWDRASGRFERFAAPGIPLGQATSLTVAPSGMPVVGLPGSLAWLTPRGWQQSAAGLFSSGVVAVASRAEGGVWVGFPQALGYFAEGTLTVVSRRYQVRGLALGQAGRVWVATAGHGLVEISGERLIEHTTEQGLCGNRIRQVAAAADGRVTVTCADAGAASRVSLRSGGKWFTYQLHAAGGAVTSAQPYGDGVLVEAGPRWWWLRPGAAPLAQTGPRAEAISMVGVLAPALPSPPKPVKPPAPAAPAAPAPAAKPAEEPAAKPAEEPAEKPAAPKPAAPKPAPTATGTGAGTQAGPSTPTSTTPAPATAVTPAAPGAAAGGPAPAAVIAPTTAAALAASAPSKPAEYPIQRAGDVAGNPNMAPRLTMEDAQHLRGEGRIATWTVGPDGLLWTAVNDRGVFARNAKSVRRYTSLSLVPQEGARLSRDHEGNPVLAQGEREVMRFKDGRWSFWPVFSSAKGPVLAVQADKSGGTWAVVAVTRKARPAAQPPEGTPPADAPPPPAQPAKPVVDLQILKSEAGEVFTEVARLPLPPLDGPPRLGGIAFQPGGHLLMPLFWTTPDGELHAVGLARAVAATRLEIWEGSLSYEEPSEVPVLPDAWISAVKVNPAGHVYLSTNSGLVRFIGKTMRVFDENDFIASEVMTDVAIGANGRVWAGTVEGLGYLEGSTWKAVAFAPLTGKINALVAGPAGELWVASEAGLFVEDGETWRRVPMAKGLAPSAIRDLMFDGGGALWLVTTQGIMRYRPQP